MTATAVTHDGFDQRVQRLIELSVGATYDAHEDVAWDDPEYAVDPADPRLEPLPFDPVRRTRRFQELSAEERSRLGRDRIAASMRIGWQFENILQQGLLRQALRMGNDDRRFAYVHHELIEESQHSMMFHEFARRHAPHVGGMLAIDLWIAQHVMIPFASTRAPALFWFLVLGGEVPIDTLQRRALREDVELHPLVERINRIHVEEEARHVSFASHELRRRVPRMSRLGRFVLGLFVPLFMAVMARMMVLPALPVVRAWDIPLRDLVRAARHPVSRQLLRDSVARIRSLCDELGLLSRPAVALWRLGGIWDEPAR